MMQAESPVNISIGQRSPTALRVPYDQPTAAPLSSFPSTEKNLKQKVVTFDEINMIETHYVQRAEDMSMAEVDGTWYDKSDYELINARNKLTVKLMRIRRTAPESFGHCYRGLEYGLSPSDTRRNMIMSRANHAVLEEQQRQRESSINDPELLAIIYQGYTNVPVRDALRYGERDAEAAARIAVEPPENNMQIMSEKRINEYVVDISESEEDNISVLSDGVTDTALSSDYSSTKSPRKLVKRLKKMLRYTRRNSTGTKDGFRLSRNCQ